MLEKINIASLSQGMQHALLQKDLLMDSKRDQTKNVRFSLDEMAETVPQCREGLYPICFTSFQMSGVVFL